MSFTGDRYTLGFRFDLGFAKCKIYGVQKNLTVSIDDSSKLERVLNARKSRSWKGGGLSCLFGDSRGY